MYRVEIYIPDQEEPAFTLPYDGIDKAQAIGDVAKRAGQTVQVTIGDKVVMEYDIRNVITFPVENSNSPTPRL